MLIQSIFYHNFDTLPSIKLIHNSSTNHFYHARYCYSNFVCCLSRSSILWKRLNILLLFLHHSVPKSFSFCAYQTSSRNSDGVTPCGALNTGGLYKFRDFRPISRYISQTIQDSAILLWKANRKPHLSF